MDSTFLAIPSSPHAWNPRRGLHPLWRSALQPEGKPFVKWNPRRQSKLLLQIKPVGSDRAVVTHADMSMMIELACAHMADRLAQLSSEFSGTPGNETVR